jgi:hypothetical protein
VEWVKIVSAKSQFLAGIFLIEFPPDKFRTAGLATPYYRPLYSPSRLLTLFGFKMVAWCYLICERLI